MSELDAGYLAGFFCGLFLGGYGVAKITEVRATRRARAERIAAARKSR